MDGWTDGQAGRRTDEQTDVQMDGQTNRETDRQGDSGTAPTTWGQCNLFLPATPDVRPAWGWLYQTVPRDAPQSQRYTDNTDTNITNRYGMLQLIHSSLMWVEPNCPFPEFCPPPDSLSLGKPQTSCHTELSVFKPPTSKSASPPAGQGKPSC